MCKVCPLHSKFEVRLLQQRAGNQILQSNTLGALNQPVVIEIVFKLFKQGTCNIQIPGRKPEDHVQVIQQYQPVFNSFRTFPKFSSQLILRNRTADPRP